MSINLGNNKISPIKLGGGVEIDKVYLGSTLVYQNMPSTFYIIKDGVLQNGIKETLYNAKSVSVTGGARRYTINTAGSSANVFKWSNIVIPKNKFTNIIFVAQNRSQIIDNYCYLSFAEVTNFSPRWCDTQSLSKETITTNINTTSKSIINAGITLSTDGSSFPSTGSYDMIMDLYNVWFN